MKTILAAGGHTVQVPVQVQVPVASCSKCRKEQAFGVVGRVGQDGHLHFVLQPPFKTLVVGQRGVLLCDECFRFVVGGIEAMGVEFPKEPIAS